MIKGIDLAEEFGIPRLIEFGKLKIGRKSAVEKTSSKGTKYRVPEKLDHFLITGMDRDENGDLRVDDQLMASLAN